MGPLTKAAYDDRLVHIDREKAKAAFEKAWEIRNFEIELYWKRATYFWAFIASTLVGYFALVNADRYREPDPHQHAEVYFLICIGFLLSVAWLLTNRGSKQWQRHWEIHVDLLEDQFTGPLYKTVNPEITFSVSKINEIVSGAFVAVWAMLGIKYLFDKDLVNATCDINWFVVLSTVVTGLLATAMFFGHGRGRFGEREVRMHERAIRYADPTYLEKPSNSGLCPVCGAELSATRD